MSIFLQSQRISKSKGRQLNKKHWWRIVLPWVPFGFKVWIKMKRRLLLKWKNTKNQKKSKTEHDLDVAYYFGKNSKSKLKNRFQNKKMRTQPYYCDVDIFFDHFSWKWWRYKLNQQVELPFQSNFFHHITIFYFIRLRNT